MKQLQKTPFVSSVLRAIVGSDVDIDSLAVFEATATSTIPLRGKDGTIHEKAVIAPHTLSALAELANNEGAPLMMDHNMDGSPFGKFFYGQVMPQENGHTELRSLFYVDSTEDKLIAKMDAGTVDEVSIAFLPEKMNCNQCGFDYMAALKDGDVLPLITRECENGHKIGVDGTHIILNGVQELLELSVVSRGAAKNSKIIGQSESKLGMDGQRLAAKGLDINELYVTATATNEGSNDMSDITTLVTQLSDTKGDLKVALADRARLEEELSEAKGARSAADKRVTELEAELATARQEADEAPSAEEKQEAKQDKEDKDKAKTFLSAQYEAVMLASGKTKDEITVPETVAELIAGIEEHKAELSALFPIGGKSVGAADDNREVVSGNLDHFKTRR